MVVAEEEEAVAEEVVGAAFLPEVDVAEEGVEDVEVLVDAGAEVDVVVDVVVVEEEWEVAKR